MTEEKNDLKEKEFALRLAHLLDVCIAEAREMGIPISTDIKEVRINRRAKSRFGCCKIMQTSKRRSTKRCYEIEIAAVMAPCGDQEIKTVLLHELLHTCRGCMNHGKRWQAYADALNKKYGYQITTCSRYADFGLPAPEPKEAVHYVIVCQQCGMTYMRKRRCKLVENTGLYRCGKCGGTLQLGRVSTTSCR